MLLLLPLLVLLLLLPMLLLMLMLLMLLLQLILQLLLLQVLQLLLIPKLPTEVAHLGPQNSRGQRELRGRPVQGSQAILDVGNGVLHVVHPDTVGHVALWKIVV